MWKWFLIPALLCVTGCASNAMVELSVAKTLKTTATELAKANQEYKTDLTINDDLLEKAALAEFIKLITAANGDETKIANAQTAFLNAMTKIRFNREIIVTRYSNTEDNILAIKEIADTLERFAIDSMSLNDEWRRLTEKWYTDYSEYKAAKAVEQEANKERRQQNREQYARDVAGMVGVTLP